jgi:hypothetical protein
MRLTSASALFVCATLASSAALPDENAADETPAAWGVTGSGQQSGFESYVLRMSRNAALSGKASAVLTADEKADPDRFGATVQASSAASFRGKRVELSAYIACENAPAGASIWLRADDAQGNVVAFDNSMTRGIRGTVPWTYQTIVLDVPLNAVALLYGAILNGKGALYIDDVQFRTVNTDVPVTAQPPLQQLSTGWPPDTSSLAPEPRNLDFEQTVPALTN